MLQKVHVDIFSEDILQGLFAPRSPAVGNTHPCSEHPSVLHFNSVSRPQTRRGRFGKAVGGGNSFLKYFNTAGSVRQLGHLTIISVTFSGSCVQFNEALYPLSGWGSSGVCNSVSINASDVRLISVVFRSCAFQSVQSRTVHFPSLGVRII